MQAIEIHALDAIDATFDATPHPIEAANAHAIGLHWQKLTSANPALWNGKVLVQRDWSRTERRYACTYCRVNYATLLAWRDGAIHGPPLRNGFAAAALRTSDHAFLLGLMAEKTANAGRWHFPAGTPDMNDVTRDGKVDLATSLERELAEETGLQVSDYGVNPTWYAVEAGPRVAFVRIVDLKADAASAKAEIDARLPTLAEHELTRMIIVRSSQDIDRQRTPPFFAAFLDAAFDGTLP